MTSKQKTPAATLPSENTDPFRPARSIALYSWPERFEFSKRPDIVLELEASIHVLPGKIRFSSGSQNKNVTLSSAEKLAAKMKDDVSFDSFSMRRIINRDERNPELAITLSHGDNWADYHLQVNADTMTVADVINHVRTFSKFFTPKYGYSTVMPSFEAFWFHGGVGTTSMDYDTRKRADAIGDLRMPYGTLNPIKSRIHDIYEINVLSPEHMTREVFGETLSSWVTKGNRGELIKIKESMHVWHVPDNVRPTIRDQFLKAGLLLVPV